MTFASEFKPGVKIMKTLAATAFVFCALATGFAARPAQAEVSVRVTVRGFYDELAPYGRWVNCRYGRCWVPRRVARRWQPYTNGRWVYTDYGWTWLSRDPWGGTPYHYGTWVYLSGYGWSWVPGTVWAPAWVTWSYSDRYVGWAPLPPSFACGGSGYSGRPIVVSRTQYVFVPANRFVDTDIAAAWVSPQQSATIFRQTRPVTHFAVSDGIITNTGVPIAAIQGATGGRIERRSINTANTTPRAMAAAGGGNTRRMPVVAPARELTAAVSSRPAEPSRHAPPSSAPPARVENGGRARAVHESPASRSPHRQEGAPPRAAAGPEHREPKAPKVHEQAPPQSHGRPAQASPAERRAEPAPRQPRGRSEHAAPAERRQEAQPPRPQEQSAQPAQQEHHHGPPPRPEAAQPAPAPPGKAAPAKPEHGHEKPPKKEKDKDQKHDNPQEPSE
jgi:hypothetical protein